MGHGGLRRKQMASFLKTNRSQKENTSPAIFMLMLLFFFVIPSIPILIALLEQSEETSYIGETRYELTEEGKKIFKNKEVLIAKYMEAANRYQIPWEYLGAIHMVESNLSLSMKPDLEQQVTSETPIDQIKVGPMGFLERNWVGGWGDQGENDFLAEYPDARTPLSDQGDLKNSFYETIINPKVIKQFEGLGEDGNGDGKADPYQIDDALMTAAKKLKEDGISEGKIEQALASYNQKPGYSNLVEKKAQEMSSYVRVISSSEQVPTGSVQAMIDHAYQLYYNRTINYVWGGNQYPNFDCSSWVQYMYKKHLGISLHRVTRDQVKQGTFVPRDQLMPGDLVFFADETGVYHVGMYVGDGKMIHNANSQLDMKLDSIDHGYYRQNYHSGRRYTQADSID